MNGLGAFTDSVWWTDGVAHGARGPGGSM